MNEIKCPNCKTVFQINEQDYDSIVKQIRDNEPNMPISLFGNKSDLKEQRAVEQSDINTLCQNEKLEYFETSAKDNTGISEGFAKVASLGFKIFGNKTGGQKLVVKKKKKKCCKS